jgi:rhodanese-related sulfurtransferase
MPRETIEQILEHARGELERVTPAEAREAIARGGLLVDIRSERQRERDGAVPGAAYFPRNVLEWRADPSSPAHDPRFGDLDRPVIVMCDEGYQSSLAAATLKRLGFCHATDLIGGYQAWRAAGLPVESVLD